MKAKYLLNILILMCFQFSISQNEQKVDSLENVFKKLDDSISKVKILEELYYAEIYTTPKKGLEYAQKALTISMEKEYWSGVGVAYYHIGVYHKLTFNIDSAYHYYNKSLEVWNKHPDLERKASTLSSIAGLEQEKGNFLKAIQITKETNKINRENGFWLNYGNGLSSLGDLYRIIGNYKLAYEKSIEGLRVLDTIEEEPWRDADVQRQIGNIETNRGNYNEALKFLEKALETYNITNDKIYQGHTIVDIGNVHHELKNHEKALELYQKSYDIGLEIGVIDMQANALSNMGMNHTKLGNYNQAITYLKKAIALNKTNNSMSNLVSSLGEMGNAYSAKGDFNKAMTYFNQAIKLADSTGLISLKSMALAYRSETFEKQRNYKNALLDTKNYNEINDSIFTKQKSLQIEELKTIYETEKKEAEIALQKEEIKTLNQNIEIENLRKGLYAGGMFTFVAVSALLFFGFKQRIKKNQIEREKQEEIYKQEIAFKKKELASQTLHLVQKNTFIQELKDNLEKIKQSPELFKIEFRRLVMLLKKESAEDKDWEVFKSYFTEVHNNFDMKLKEVYPEISEKEIRLASFLRMNLSTKEIASMLNVLPDSVLKSKYRLKKKLKLDKETDLTGFLNSL
ncbi:tetratricopeptide repeat protein [Tamlana crocina]